MRQYIVVGVFGLLVTGTVPQTGEAFNFESVLVSGSVDLTRQEIENHPVPQPDQHPSQAPGATDEHSITPNLPPPAMDPEIVHEPPPNPNPEAVIAPPKIDPEMAVHPRTFPGYPDNPDGGTGNVDAEDMPGEKGSPPK